MLFIYPESIAVTTSGRSGLIENDLVDEHRLMIDPFILASSGSWWRSLPSGGLVNLWSRAILTAGGGRGWG
jgi:hypothetical protein